MKSIPELLSRLQSHTHRSPADQDARSVIPNLELVLFIVDWSMFKLVFSAFEEEKVLFHFISKGRGTATSETLDLLGLGTGEKAVLACLEQPAQIPVLVKEVRKRLASQQGRGIAFTIPLSAINSPLLRAFSQMEISAGRADHDTKRQLTHKRSDHSLVFSVVNQGYVGEFMNIAREAGARGGTVISARGRTQQGVTKFFGVSVQDERELILILTSREKKRPIMQALSGAHGLDSKSQGIMFSLPVDKTMSLSFEQELST